MTERYDEFRLRVDEEDAFATENADLSAAEGLDIWGWTGDPQRAQIDDLRYVTDFGTYEAITGLTLGEQVSFNSYAEGLRTAASDAVAAVETSFTWFLQAVLGKGATVSTGDTVTTGATVSSIPVTTPGRHVANGACGFVKSNGDIEVALVLSDNPIVPAIKLSEAPADGSVLYGAVDVEFDENPTTFPTVQCIRVGNDDAQTQSIYGMAGSFSLPEVGVDEPQTVAWTFNLADFLKGSTETRPASTGPRPEVLAGGQIKLAAYHASAAQDYICVKYAGMNLDMALALIGDRNVCSDIGIDGWRRSKSGRPTISFLVEHDSDPSAAAGAPGAGLGLTLSTWEALRDAGGAENNFQVTFQAGRTGGKIFFVSLRGLKLVSAIEEEVDEIAVQRLTFELKTGYTAPAIVVSQL
jgi:hypothetical protein